MSLDTPIEELPCTSARTIQRLKALEIHTYYDLLHYYPARHDDRTMNPPISSLQPGEKVTIKGTIEKIQNNFTRRGFKIQKAKLTDGTGTIELVWYNQMYLMRTLQEGTQLAVYGEVEQYGNKVQMKPQEYELLHNAREPIHTARLVPIYAQTYGLSTKTIRKKVYWLLKNMDKEIQKSEFLPPKVVSYAHMIDEPTALSDIHFPKSTEDLNSARCRLGFDELFIRMLTSKKIKEQWDNKIVTKQFDIASYKKNITAFISTLPFTLTRAQKKVVKEITQDLEKTSPMNRFLQGDVGSGKTVVAAIAAYIAHLNGMQTLIMAPTEILAQQHYGTLTQLFGKLDVSIGLHTRTHKSLTTSKKNNAQFNIIVGTQALITQSIEFDNVGLVVIDEQHRFGVRQRALLKQKGFNPHLLTMTATPIPRTVALTLYSELDLSVIDEMPKGRKHIKTYVINKHKRNDCYEWIKKQIKTRKDQVYIICPLIEESEAETMQTVKAATCEYEELNTNVFKKESVALLHGKLKSKEKKRIMEEFNGKTYDILVSTSVVEVGVDVPNATIMIIEGAERFGLAQLHQLRGRVGRGTKQSYCFLFSSDGKKTYARLGFFARTHNGMQLAEFDLKKRGAGDIYGTAQHGYTNLQLADITDIPAVHRAQAAVQLFLDTYDIAQYHRLDFELKQYRIQQISKD